MSTAGRRSDEIGSGSLRQRTARGTVVNSLWLAALAGLGLAKGILAAAFLGASDYGIWGLLTIVFGTLGAIAAFGVDDKYIQQDHPDQRAAFEIAFTFQCIVCGAFAVVGVIAVPLFALLYDTPEIVAPGIVLSLAYLLVPLQAPIWVFYRRMQFVRQRVLQSYDLVVSFVVTVALAAAGMSYWSLVIGAVAGFAAGALMAVRAAPYPLRLRFDRESLAEYSRFSWPLWLSGISGAVTGQTIITAAARALGTAAVGAIALSTTISSYTRRVDDLVTDTLYPAICAVKDRADLLFESFSKSNRLALLWGFPAGIGLALFADDIVHHLFGEDWELAIPVLKVLGVTAAVDQIGFNWTAYARARGETRPLAVAAGAFMIVMIAVGVPLIHSEGIEGYAIALAAGTFASLVIRAAYLVRLFPALRLLTHVSRAILPTIPAALLILGERAVAGGGTGPARAAAEVAGYVVVVAVGTVLAERALLREAIGYLRRDPAPTGPAAN